MTEDQKRAERILLASSFHAIILKAACRDKKGKDLLSADVIAQTAVRHADALLAALNG